MPTESRPSLPPGSAPRPASGGVSQGAQTAATIDPLKLLRKYKWVLLFAAIFGAGAGYAGYQVLLRVSPSYSSFVIFQINTKQTRAGVLEAGYDKGELESFMATQIQRMTSENILQRVAGDFRVRDDIEWAKQFVQRNTEGGVSVDIEAATLALQKQVGARVLGRSQLVRLDVSAPSATDAARLAGMIRREYLQQLSQIEENQFRNELAAVVGQINDITNGRGNINDQIAERQRLLLENRDIDSIDGASRALELEISKVGSEISELMANLAAAQARFEQYERESKSPTGVQYSDELRVQVEGVPIVGQLKQQLSSLETFERTLQMRGIGPQHPQRKGVVDQIRSVEAQLETTRERELQRLFFGQREIFARTVESFNSQIATLEQERDRLKTSISELTQTKGLLRDINRSIQELETRRAELGARADNLRALMRDAQTKGAATNLDGVTFLDRIAVAQVEQAPGAPVFPRLSLLGPAGVVVFVGLAGGLCVLREVLDKRVKGASDVAIIPRTRVLGMVPDAGEDPAGVKVAETAFRDHPRGAFAEQFRQLRAPILRQMREGGIRSVVIAPGMPRSGATTISLNLALALAASDMRVLLIDANMRRPRLHTLLGLADSPGLSDVLAGASAIKPAIIGCGVDNLDLLPVGSDANRVFERLGSSAMGELVAQASERYDAVLIDAPPMIVSSDALSLAGRVDASVLVVRAYSERRGMVARLKNDLLDAQAEFLGVIVNGVQPSAGGYIAKNIRATHQYQAKAG